MHVIHRVHYYRRCRSSVQIQPAHEMKQRGLEATSGNHFPTTTALNFTRNTYSVRGCVRLSVEVSPGTHRDTSTRSSDPPFIHTYVILFLHARVSVRRCRCCEARLCTGRQLPAHTSLAIVVSRSREGRGERGEGGSAEPRQLRAQGRRPSRWRPLEVALCA